MIAAAGVLVMLVFRPCDSREREPLDAQLVQDAATSDVLVPPSDMACFKGAKIRAGDFNASQRPPKCSALNPAEDCMRPQSSTFPERALADFCVDKHEVTNQDFSSWLESKPEMWLLNSKDPTVIQSRTKPRVFLVRTGEECSLTLVNGRARPGPGKEKQPVTCVTWMAARDYCRARDKQLPLELEWEFAAKGIEGRPFPWGPDMPRLDGVAFDRGDSTEKHPVDVGVSDQDVSPQGIRDLGGNVAEWVADEGGSGETAIIRGGSWNSRDPCRLLGSSCERIPAEQFSRDVGFRCAKRVTRDKGRE